MLMQSSGFKMHFRQGSTLEHMLQCLTCTLESGLQLSHHALRAFLLAKAFNNTSGFNMCLALTQASAVVTAHQHCLQVGCSACTGIWWAERGQQQAKDAGSCPFVAALCGQPCCNLVNKWWILLYCSYSTGALYHMQLALQPGIGPVRQCQLKQHAGPKQGSSLTGTLLCICTSQWSDDHHYHNDDNVSHNYITSTWALCIITSAITLLLPCYESNNISVNTYYCICSFHFCFTEGQEAFTFFTFFFLFCNWSYWCLKSTSHWDLSDAVRPLNPFQSIVGFYLRNQQVLILSVDCQSINISSENGTAHKKKHHSSQLKNSTAHRKQPDSSRYL